MLVWLFSTYCAQAALCVTAPLLAAGLTLPPLAAYLLGQPSQQVARARRLTALTLLVVALAAIHLLLLLGGRLALARAAATQRGSLVDLLLGTPGYDPRRLLAATGVLLVGGGLATLAVHTQLREGGGLREWANKLRNPQRQRDALGVEDQACGLCLLGPPGR